MLVAVSPYHITTREPAAVAAFLLAERVVTLLPAPFSGAERQRIEQVAERIPRYLDFMLSWQWSVPLWQAGVICSALDGHDAMPDVRAAHSQIAADDRYRSLRGLIRPELFEVEEAYLNAVAGDLLKGGPDPGITVPVAAGLDRFAHRHGMAVARSEPASVVQKAERQLGEPVFALVVPVLLQASAERLIEARDLLEDELQDLRAAINAQIGLPAEPGRRGRGNAELQEAAAAYTRAFESHHADLTEPDDSDDARVIDGLVAITGVTLPIDAVFTSSLAAMRAISPLAAVSAPPCAAPVPVPAHAGALGPQRVLSLIVKVMGRTPSPRR